MVQTNLCEANGAHRKETPLLETAIEGCVTVVTVVRRQDTGTGGGTGKKKLKFSQDQKKIIT